MNTLLALHAHSPPQFGSVCAQLANDPSPSTSECTPSWVLQLHMYPHCLPRTTDPYPVTNLSRIHSCTAKVLPYMLLLSWHTRNWVFMESNDNTLPGWQVWYWWRVFSGSVKPHSHFCYFYLKYQLQKFLFLLFKLAIFLSKISTHFLSHCLAQLTFMFLFSTIIFRQMPSRLYCVFHTHRIHTFLTRWLYARHLPTVGCARTHIYTYLSFASQQYQ